MKEEILNMEVGTIVDWKFGLITREIYRIDEESFEINEVSGQWLVAVVNKKTMTRLLDGKLSLLDLEWK